MKALEPLGCDATCARSRSSRPLRTTRDRSSRTTFAGPDQEPADQLGLPASRPCSTTSSASCARPAPSAKGELRITEELEHISELCLCGGQSGGGGQSVGARARASAVAAASAQAAASAAASRSSAAAGVRPRARAHRSIVSFVTRSIRRRPTSASSQGAIHGRDGVPAQVRVVFFPDFIFLRVRSKTPTGNI